MITSLLNLKHADWYKNHEPLQLNLLSEKYLQVERALLLTEYHRESNPMHSLHSIQCWKFIMCDYSFLKSGNSLNECYLDNMNVIQINLCKQKGTSNFVFLWSIRRQNNEITGDDGAILKCNIRRTEFRTNDEQTCLRDITEAYYEEITRIKFHEAGLPKAGRIIKYQDKLFKVKNCHYRGKNNVTLLDGNPFDMLLKLEKNADKLDKIQNSLDWHVHQREQYVKGEVKCTKCKTIGYCLTLDIRAVEGYGPLCGPCRDHLYENDLITDSMWDEMFQP